MACIWLVYEVHVFVFLTGSLPVGEKKLSGVFKLVDVVVGLLRKGKPTIA